jgi:hypothetical protein
MGVERLRTCEVVSEWARELGVTRGCFYKRRSMDRRMSCSLPSEPSTSSRHRATHNLMFSTAGARK